MSDLKHFKLSGHNLAYFEKGSGEPILFLHGYPQNHSIWSYQLDELSKRNRVIAPDLFGWGSSDRPLDISFKYEADLARLYEFIDKVVGEKFNLVGHDYGGFLSTGIVCQTPDRVLRLALLNTRAHLTFPIKWYLILGFTSKIAWISKFVPLFWIIPHYSAHQTMLRSLKGKVSDTKLQAYISQFHDKSFLRWLQHFYGEGYRVEIRSEAKDNLRRYRSPVALIWGKNDPYFPLTIAEDIQRILPQAKLTILNCGHFPAEEEAEKVLQQLMELLVLPQDSN